jgi:alkaline phosphatase D
MQWLKQTMAESHATFRVLISPTPIVGPDRPTKQDNHSCTGFAYEGNRVRDFLGGLSNVFVINGDLHRQHASIDKRTGIREYGVGAATNEHATKLDVDPDHPNLRYSNPEKGGFLSVSITGANGQTSACVSHHAVDGTVFREDRLECTNVPR